MAENYKEMYQKLVGNPLSHTRPDITSVVKLVSLYMHDPVSSSLRIVRYLKSTPGKGILITRNNHLMLEAYTNTNWVSSKEDRSSISVYCVFLGRIW